MTADPAPDADTCPAPGLRERKKLATRRALGFAAMRLAVERGLDNVHTDDIAAAAGVSPRTFNNYFSSKHEAICTLEVDRARRTGDALRRRPAGEPFWDAITAAVLEQYGEGGEQPPGRELMEGIRLVTRSPELRGEFLKAQWFRARVLAEAIGERTGTDVAADMFPRIMAGAVTAAVQVAQERWLFADPPVAAAPLIREAMRQLAEGLPAAGAVRLTENDPPGREQPA